MFGVKGFDKNKKDSAMNLNLSVTWVKKLIPSSVATQEELKTMTAKSFRKGFSNWGDANPDPQVRLDTLEAQDHSAAVDRTNYHVKSARRVHNVNKTIMGEVMTAGSSGSGEARPGEAVDGAGGSDSVQVKKRRGRFMQNEREFMLMALGSRRADGTLRPPTGVNNAGVVRAKAKFPH